MAVVAEDELWKFWLVGVLLVVQILISLLKRLVVLRTIEVDLLIQNVRFVAFLVIQRDRADIQIDAAKFQQIQTVLNDC